MWNRKNRYVKCMSVLFLTHNSRQVINKTHLDTYGIFNETVQERMVELHDYQKLLEAKQVELASTRLILYDDDCPELTVEQIKAFECAVRQRN